MSDEPKDEPDTSGWVSPGRPVPGPPPQSEPPAGYPAVPQPPQAYPPQPPQPPQPPLAYPPQPPRSYPPQPHPPGAGQQPAAGWYPEQPYYGPGWQAPLAAPPAPVGGMPARRLRSRAEVVLRVIAAVAAVTVLVGAAIGARYWLDTRPLGAVTKAMTVNAVRIDTGHCLATLPPDGAVGAAHVVPCGEPHVAEVIASLPIKGTSWPGSQQVTDQLVAWCEMDSAETALGLEPVIWEPSSRGWAQGDRSGLCLAWSPTGTMTGSFVAGDTVTAG